MKKLGFGLMRLPMNGNEVDNDTLCKMVDHFMERGFTYFDTAHGYVSEKSEIAARECLTSRYPRESYMLTDKLTENYFNSREDIAPFVQSQLDACGVEYFDYYLMHALNKNNYRKFKECRAFEEAEKLKAEGKIKHIGFSFHDTADVLDMILTEQPQVEAVQLQFNYADFNSAGVQSKACYDVCVKHGKPVIVMEPVKGGALADPPEAAKGLFDALGSGLSYASYAVRFAASFENVMVVLSGMSNMEQMNDNTSYMESFVPFTDEEYKAAAGAAAIISSIDSIPCTACRYCTDGCPMKINIPEIFSCVNAKKMYNDWNSDVYYGVYANEGGKASDCVECGQCESVCPQKLGIIGLLKQSAEIFER